MATYLELKELFVHSDLMDKMQVACLIAAETIRTEDVGTANHANRLIWAKKAFSGPSSVAPQMLMELLASNNALSTAGIIGATDAAIQTKVDAAVDIFADGS